MPLSLAREAATWGEYIQFNHTDPDFGVSFDLSILRVVIIDRFQIIVIYDLILGLFFPQGFLTAILQNYARKHQYPIDTITFSFIMMSETLQDLTNKPTDGSYIHGLYLEGARWNRRLGSLVDPKPKELFSSMPIIHMLPQRDRPPPTRGIYRCPVYKILSRTGTLSTTGHSTNFVAWIEIPSNKDTIHRNSLVSETNAQIQFCDQDYWVKAGVACFCSLKY